MKKFLILCECLVLVAFAAFVLRRSQQQARLRFEASVASYNQNAFQRVKEGGESASVIHPGLLPMLAGDHECIENLKHIAFMNPISEDEAAYLASLKNVSNMYFYCVAPSDILAHAQHLPIKQIDFELVFLSAEEVQSLGEIELLERVAFHGQVIHPEYLALLDGLPDKITVDLDDSEVGIRGVLPSANAD